MTATIRPAAADIAAIVALFAEDELGLARETPDDLASYQRAFAALATDPSQHLVIAEDETGVVGTLQLTLIPGLARTAACGGQIEAVRVRADARDAGGRRALRPRRSRKPGRPADPADLGPQPRETRVFYERLGFTPSHIGYKLDLW